MNTLDVINMLICYINMLFGGLQIKASKNTRHYKTVAAN